MDGTKNEANANRYTFVWGKAVNKHKAKLQEKVQALFEGIEAAEKQEEQEHRGQDLNELGGSTEMNSGKLEQVTQALESQLLEKPKDKSLKKAVRKLRKDLLPRLQKYEQYQKLLGDRNSFSK
ncbi:IS1182 family transposase, partial [Paenibacillus rhizoplanae]